MLKVFFTGTHPLDRLAGDSMEAHVVAGLRACGVDARYFPFISSLLGARIHRLLDFVMTDYRWIRSTPVERAMLKALIGYRPDLVLVLLGNYTNPGTIRKIPGGRSPRAQRRPRRADGRERRRARPPARGGGLLTPSPASVPSNTELQAQSAAVAASSR